MTTFAVATCAYSGEYVRLDIFVLFTSHVAVLRFTWAQII